MTLTTYPHRMITLVAAMTLMGCSSKYEGWQRVRLQNEPAGPGCIYRAQEICTEIFIGGRCLEWQKKHAVLNNANIVVITSRAKRDQVVGGIKSSGSGVLLGGQLDEVIADHYWCPENSSR